MNCLVNVFVISYLNSLVYFVGKSAVNLFAETVSNLFEKHGVNWLIKLFLDAESFADFLADSFLLFLAIFFL